MLLTTADARHEKQYSKQNNARSVDLEGLARRHDLRKRTVIQIAVGNKHAHPSDPGYPLHIDANCPGVVA